MKNRRDFIKLSAAGLCGLGAMQNLSAAPAASKDNPRFIFLRKSNGTAPEWLTPPSLKNKAGGKNPMEVDLDKLELQSWMQPIAKYKKNLCILQNMSAKMCSMGHVTTQSPLAVCRASENPMSIRRASVDIELGRMFPSPFGHIEFTCAKNSKGIVRGMSSIGPQQPNFAFATPKTAFENLFVLASSNKQSQVKNIVNNKLHSFINSNIMPANPVLQSREEKAKLHNYSSSVDSLIERNKQLEAIKDKIKKYAPTLNDEIMKDNYNVVEQQNAFVDVILASLYAGLTNSVTFTLDNLQTKMTGIVEGEEINIHDVGHGKPVGSVPALEVRNRLRTHHMTVVNSLVEGLKSMPEGNGTMFDNTIIMYLPENGETHHSKGTHVPFLILTGDNVKLDTAGRFIQLPGYSKGDHKTLGNFYTTLLNAYGNPTKHYGDLDPGLAIDQKGPIQQLMKG